MTQEELAVFCLCDQTMVSRVEGAECDPPDGFAEGCDKAFPEMGGFFTDYQASTRDWEGGTVVKPWFRPWVHIEEAATEILWWEHDLIPGLGQSPAYAEAMFASPKGVTAEQVKRDVQIRLGRQDILDRDDPPEVWLLISEFALTNCIGDAKIMAGQMAHLLEMSDRPNTTIQIVPDCARTTPGLSGAFAIATVSSGQVVYMETAVQGMTIHDPAIIGKAVLLFGRLRAEALSATASQERLTKVGEQWKL
jgi:hypothetical protein